MFHFFPRISLTLVWSFPDFFRSIVPLQIVLKKLSQSIMPKVTTITGTNAAIIRVIRLKPIYPALCFVAPKKVQSMDWLYASLSSHYLLSLVHSLLGAFTNALEGVSTPKSTHSIVGRGLLPC